MGALYDNNKNYATYVPSQPRDTIVEIDILNHGYSYLRLSLMQERVNVDKITLIYSDEEMVV